MKMQCVRSLHLSQCRDECAKSTCPLMGPGRVKITREARTHVRDGAFCACRDSNSAGIDLLAAPDAPRGFLQALMVARSWLHARIASSNPPTPTIITRFML